MAEIEIPKKCKAGVVVNPGPDFHLEVRDVDVPEPGTARKNMDYSIDQEKLSLVTGPTELLLRLNCTGLCMSDVHYMLNDLPFPKQMQDFGVFSPGHEGAGVVVKVGEHVKGWKVGDRAGVKPMWDVCHACEQCWTGIEQWCPNRLNSGIEVTGTYQQYIVSRMATRIFPCSCKQH
jgi:alcohol dehydrogenase, propanol-preferring